LKCYVAASNKNFNSASELRDLRIFQGAFQVARSFI